MGMDAYAVGRDGKHLECKGEFPRRELVDATAQRVFSRAESVVAKQCDGVDADLKLGRLGISANASAVNHIMYWHGARPGTDETYPAESVRTVAVRLAAGATPPLPIPEYVTNDASSIVHATEFIKACAELGLGIEISP